MTVFSNNPYDRRMERLMMTVPNFAPRGVGVRFSESQILITVTAAIIENGGYTELTYEEFRRREQICPLYADKLFLPLYGRLMEVSKEDYTEFYRAKRRQKYLDERSAENGDFSYDMLTTDEFSGEDILIAEQPDVCDAVVESIMTDKLRKAILKLSDEEQLLIYRHYTPVFQAQTFSKFTAYHNRQSASESPKSEQSSKIF